MNKSDYLALKHWAVAGDVLNPDKYAYRIVKKLESKGYNVSGLHPTGGDGIFTELKALPHRPDVLCLVINPRAGEQYLREAASLGINNVWLQPGADTEQIMALCKELSLNYVQACVLVELSR